MLTRLFCNIDNFCHDSIPQWEATWLEKGQKKQKRTHSISQSEIITLVVYFHKIGYEQKQIVKFRESSKPLR